MKCKILIAANKAGEGHIASSFSILDILFVLYSKILKYDPQKPDCEIRDRVILSKGHASLALYAILSEFGFFPAEELDRFGEFDSILGGHPDCRMVPGVECSTGSLGHGMPVAIGIALALKIKKNHSRVFVIVGDGECNEGTIWEASMLAAHQKLNNITCIIDYNHSNDRALKLESLEQKFESFGWKVYIINGHDHDVLFEILKKENETMPIAIIAETIKGKGIKEMENNPAWHHKSPTNEELLMMLDELK